MKIVLVVVVVVLVVAVPEGRAGDEYHDIQMQPSHPVLQFALNEIVQQKAALQSIQRVRMAYGDMQKYIIELNMKGDGKNFVCTIKLQQDWKEQHPVEVLEGPTCV